MCFFIGFLFLLAFIQSANLKVLAVYFTIFALIFALFIKIDSLPKNSPK
jgi:hypothetical protein